MMHNLHVLVSVFTASNITTIPLFIFSFHFSMEDFVPLSGTAYANPMHMQSIVYHYRLYNIIDRIAYWLCLLVKYTNVRLIIDFFCNQCFQNLCTHTHSDTLILPDLNFIPRLHYNMHVYCTCIDLLFLCVSLLAICNSFGLRTSTVLDDALSFSVVAVWVYLQHAEEPCGR